ncbi:hypothetical protein M430DRAFT_58287 [Amorphotheca resinae ATCC 22711]|uniref:Developmental regulatory protein wetA n=1 Tax=Amorphotheca resinae ATCC 22711 TaxID=857342 RepID=A0A2T3B4A0_AMORE|nr:hypothetical protein M430DRAFT_58287 [Amorphotheca resinae ATCC 22711]PSS20456.1 hypothetical protein M430DRAFT_58287 [Amorphotheca resinae ATCC 22711]
MSFPAVATSPRNKHSDSFGQSYEAIGSDFFDEFLTFSPIDSKEPNYSAVPEFPFFERSSSDSYSAHTSSNSLDDGTKKPIRQDQWRGEPWAQCSVSSQGNHLYSESSGKAAVSDTELLSLEGMTLHSPKIHAYCLPSLPSSPAHASPASSMMKMFPPETPTRTLKRSTGNLERNFRSSIRKSSSLPRMIHSAHKSNPDLWGIKLESPKFSLDLQDPMDPFTPPGSTTVSDTPESSRSRKFEEDNRSYRNRAAHHFTTGLMAYETPLSTPLLDAEPPSRTTHGRQALDSFPFPPTPRTGHSSDGWTLPNSSIFDSYASPSLFTSEEDPPLWWNHPATASRAQPSPSAGHVNPQRATKSIVRQLSELSYSQNKLAHIPPNMASGLMIQMPEIPTQQSFVVETPMLQQDHFSQSRSQYQARSRQYDKAPLSRQLRLCSPVRKTGFVASEYEPPSPKSPSELHVRKRRNQRTNKHPTPRTPSLGRSVDFVNFTPDDSRKILTGVAPSGSSKTKAKREKEAMERRRKLSEAAIRAVRAAGGDVESLVEECLID